MDFQDLNTSDQAFPPLDADSNWNEMRLVNVQEQFKKELVERIARTKQERNDICPMFADNREKVLDVMESLPKGCSDEDIMSHVNQRRIEAVGKDQADLIGPEWVAEYRSLLDIAYEDPEAWYLVWITRNSSLERLKTIIEAAHGILTHKLNQIIPDYLATVGLPHYVPTLLPVFKEASPDSSKEQQIDLALELLDEYATDLTGRCTTSEQASKAAVATAFASLRYEDQTLEGYQRFFQAAAMVMPPYFASVGKKKKLNDGSELVLKRIEGSLSYEEFLFWTKRIPFEWLKEKEKEIGTPALTFTIDLIGELDPEITDTSEFESLCDYVLDVCEAHNPIELFNIHTVLKNLDRITSFPKPTCTEVRSLIYFFDTVIKEGSNTELSPDEAILAKRKLENLARITTNESNMDEGLLLSSIFGYRRAQYVIWGDGDSHKAIVEPVNLSRLEILTQGYKFLSEKELDSEPLSFPKCISPAVFAAYLQFEDWLREGRISSTERDQHISFLNKWIDLLRIALVTDTAELMFPPERVMFGGWDQPEDVMMDVVRNLIKPRDVGPFWPHKAREKELSLKKKIKDILDPRPTQTSLLEDWLEEYCDIRVNQKQAFKGGIAGQVLSDISVTFQYRSQKQDPVEGLVRDCLENAECGSSGSNKFRAKELKSLVSDWVRETPQDFQTVQSKIFNYLLSEGVKNNKDAVVKRWLKRIIFLNSMEHYYNKESLSKIYSGEADLEDVVSFLNQCRDETALGEIAGRELNSAETALVESSLQFRRHYERLEKEQKELENLDTTNLEDTEIERHEVCFRPTRGVALELAGEICETCLSRDSNLREKHPGLIFVPFIIKDSSGDEWFGGGCLVLRTQLSSGEYAFVIRGFNTNRHVQKVLNLDPGDLFEHFVEYLKKMAGPAGVKKIVIPWDEGGEAQTNWVSLNIYLRNKYPQFEPLIKGRQSFPPGEQGDDNLCVKFMNPEETTINKIPIADSCVIIAEVA